MCKVPLSQADVLAQASPHSFGGGTTNPMQRKRKNRVIPTLIVAIVLGTAIEAPAQSTPPRSLLALSKRDHTLAIVNPDNLQVIAQAPVGPDPQDVNASSDG